MNLIGYLMGAGGLLAGLIVMGGWEEFRFSSRLNTAVATERAQQVKICDAQRAADINAVNATNDAILDTALEAARSLGRTPVDQAQLQDLCNSEAACRDRRTHK